MPLSCILTTNPEFDARVDTQLYITTEHVHIVNRYNLVDLMSICSFKNGASHRRYEIHHVDKLHWRTYEGDRKQLLNRSVTHQISPYRRRRRRFFPGSVPHSFPQCGGSVINRSDGIASHPDTTNSYQSHKILCHVDFSSARSRLLLLLVALTTFFC